MCRDYHLPAYANKNTLVFCTSYSGETEETLSVFLEALKRKCNDSQPKFRRSTPRVRRETQRPASAGPRRDGAKSYSSLPIPTVDDEFWRKSISSPESTQNYRETVRILKLVSVENSPENQTKNNVAKTLATKINGTIPIVYGFRFYRAVAQRMKTQINENSKNLAKWEYFPELNHNEIVAWEEAEEFASRVSVVFVRDADEPEEIKNRIEFTKETIHKTSAKTLEVWSKGNSRIARMSSIICIGDFASVYLAVLRGVDPTPVKTISILKERLKQTGVKEKTVRELRKLSKG